MILKKETRQQLAIVRQMLNFSLPRETQRTVLEGLERLQEEAWMEFWQDQCCPTCLIVRYGPEKANDLLTRLRAEIAGEALPLSD
jgi:hypothetical protein